MYLINLFASAYFLASDLSDFATLAKAIQKKIGVNPRYLSKNAAQFITSEHGMPSAVLQLKPDGKLVMYISDESDGHYGDAAGAGSDFKTLAKDFSRSANALKVRTLPYVRRGNPIPERLYELADDIQKVINELASSETPNLAQAA